jgi:hypothetical protein
MTWTLYYEDGGTFSDLDGAPWESPSFGAVVVTQYGKEPRTCQNDPFLVHRTDLDQWFGCDVPGLYDLLSHFAQHIDCVRIGRWMPTAEYRKIKMQANEELKVRGLIAKGIIKSDKL